MARLAPLLGVSVFVWEVWRGLPSKGKFYQGGVTHAIQILSEGGERGEASHPDGPRRADSSDPGSS